MADDDHGRLLVITSSEPCSVCRRIVDNRAIRRELEVLILVAEGFERDEIGNRLGISPSTVKNHLTSLYQKLGANNRTHALLLALRHRLISLGGVTLRRGRSH